MLPLALKMHVERYKYKSRALEVRNNRALHPITLLMTLS
jgi:hypothetical protein